MSPKISPILALKYSIHQLPYEKLSRKIAARFQNGEVWLKLNFQKLICVLLDVDWSDDPDDLEHMKDIEIRFRKGINKFSADPALRDRDYEPYQLLAGHGKTRKLSVVKAELRRDRPTKVVVFVENQLRDAKRILKQLERDQEVDIGQLLSVKINIQALERDCYVQSQQIQKIKEQAVEIQKYLEFLLQRNRRLPPPSK